MISGKDITVSVPCLFPNEEPIWMMRTTCDRFGLSLRPYGMGPKTVYNGWIDMKVHRLRQEALSCPTSHILYTDARDAWFLAGPDEIAQKYNDLGCPPLLLSAQSDVFGTYAAWYPKVEWNEKKLFRYVGTPGQLCEAKALADALGWMQEHFHLGEDVDTGGLPDDDPPWWIEYMAAHPGGVRFDHDCAIFMNAGSRLPGEQDMWADCLKIIGNRVYNKLTYAWPCILHFNGGYSHAFHGKWEQLQPFWRALGNKENPPWEAERKYNPVEGCTCGCGSKWEPINPCLPRMDLVCRCCDRHKCPLHYPLSEATVEVR